MPAPSEAVSTVGEEFSDGLFEVLDVNAPCPTPGCKGRGKRVRILRTTLNLICPKCEREAEERTRDAEQADRVASLLLRSGMTPRMREWSFASYPKDESGKAALQHADKWTTRYLRRARGEPIPNLLLYGPVGGGKTGLAWSIVRHLCEQGIEARIVNFPDLIVQMQEATSKKVPFDKFSDHGRIPVLAVDDVGGERPTAWAVAQLLTLVDRRYQRMLPTIFTSNYSPDDLADRLGRDDTTIGERIVSRMVEGAMQHWIKADDRRLLG